MALPTFGRRLSVHLHSQARSRRCGSSPGTAVSEVNKRYRAYEWE